jgi:histidinol-phosphate aminotransferase
VLKPRECVATLPVYHALAASRVGLNLDLNENAGGCSPRVIETLRSLTTFDVARYPEREVGERTVAKFLGVNPDQVLLTNGADEGLHLLCEAYLGEGDEILFAQPTFTMYPIYAGATGAKVACVPYRTGFSYPTEEVIARITPRTRLIAIANPNNPTGTVVPRQDLLRIVQAAPNAAVVIDEAYFEFYGETLLDQIGRFDNLLLTRTFSKAYGLAGLRIGTVLGSAGQIGMLRRFSSPFNVNGIALACLPGALADQDFMNSYVADVREGRERVAALCRESGVESWPSFANFVLVRIGSSSKEFVTKMEQLGVLVRDRSANDGCGGCVRITVGTRAQTDQLLAAMRSVFQEVRK